MKRYLMSVALVLSLQSISTGQMVYNTYLPDMDGNSVRIKDIKGDKLTVLDFWATYCHPCISSIPALVKLSGKYQDQGVKFIGINEDSPRNISKVKPFAASIGITYPVLLDTDQKLLSDFMIEGVPTLIILDSTGKILYTHLGYANGDENSIEATIDKLLTKSD